jgi:nitrous oxide reductase
MKRRELISGAALAGLAACSRSAGGALAPGGPALVPAAGGPRCLYTYVNEKTQILEIT